MVWGRKREEGLLWFMELKALRKLRNVLFSVFVIKSCVEKILAGKPSRHAVELCNVQVFSWVCVCVCAYAWETGSRNEQNKLSDYEKMWSLFNISAHISNIHIYIFCTMNISLVCNPSGLIIASRLCHKYIIHSAIWSLCTRVSLLYMSHECVTHSMWTRSKNILFSYFYVSLDCCKSVPTEDLEGKKELKNCIRHFISLPCDLQS